MECNTNKNLHTYSIRENKFKFLQYFELNAGSIDLVQFIANLHPMLVHATVDDWTSRLSAHKVVWRWPQSACFRVLKCTARGYVDVAAKTMTEFTRVAAKSKKKFGKHSRYNYCEMS